MVEKWAKCVGETKGNVVTILTGSIGQSYPVFISESFKIPTHMYKIIIVQRDGVNYINAYMAANRRPDSTDVKISKYVIHHPTGIITT